MMQSSHQTRSLKCREYLQVLTISNISTTDGCYLNKSMLSGWSTLQPKSWLQWPNQTPQLTPQHWRIWNQALHTHLMEPNSQSLCQAIGKRTNLADWKWTYSPSKNCIYQTGLHYTFWTAIPSQTQCQRFGIGNRCTYQPNDIVPATVFICNPQNLILTGLTTLLPPNQLNPQTLSKHIWALPSTNQWACIWMDHQQQFWSRVWHIAQNRNSN